MQIKSLSKLYLVIRYLHVKNAQFAYISDICLFSGEQRSQETALVI